MKDSEIAGMGSEVSSEVTDRIRSIVRAAEELAGAIERQARERAEAQLREADDEASQRVATARRQADELLEERRRSIAALSQEIVAHAERALEDLSEAESLRRRLGALVEQLDVAAERIEALRPPSTGSEQAADDGGGAMHAPESSPPRGRADWPEAPASHLEAPFRKEPAAPERRAVAPPSPLPVERDSPNGSGERPGPADAAGAGGQEEEAEDRLGTARLVARQMAAAGSTRSEVAGHVRRTFGLSDPTAVLNEAFDRAEPRSG